MSRRNHRVALLELQGIESIDPFTLEAGSIISGRFCLIGPVSHSPGHSWSVAVTDLDRELGQPPGYQLRLFFIPATGIAGERVRQAAAADGVIQPRACAILPLNNGIAVVAEHRRQAQTPPSGHSLNTSAAIALSTLLARLHRAGVFGVRFDPGQIADTRHASLCGYTHLLTASGDGGEDVASLCQLLIDHNKELGEKLDPPPTTAEELRALLDGLSSKPQRWVAVMPQAAPFVGRKQPLGELLEAVEQARTARGSTWVFCGQRGIGKTRLLRQLSIELRERKIRTWTLRGEFSPARGSDERTAIGRALDELARLYQTMPLDEQRALGQRLQKATAPLGGVVKLLSPAMSPILGDPPSPPRISFREQLIRHAAVVSDALQAIGTPRQPLVLVLDNLDAADAGSLAILQRLLQHSAHHTVVVSAHRGDVLAAELSAARTILLEAMTAEEVEQLVVEALPGEVEPAIAVALRKATGGVPLATWSALQHWVDSGWLARDASSWAWRLARSSPGAEGVVSLYRHRIRSINEDQLWLATLIALGGEPARLTWLHEVVAWRRPEGKASQFGSWSDTEGGALPAERSATWSDERFDRAWHELIDNALLQRTKADSLRFSHDSARELLLESSGSMHRDAHAALRGWLEAQDGEVSPVQRAYHAEHVEPPGENEALASLHLEGGTVALNVFDLERAGWHFERALSRSATTSQRTRALEGKADVALLSNDIQGAADLYSAAVQQSDSLAQQVTIATKAAYGLFFRSEPELARRIAEMVLVEGDQPLPKRGLGRALRIAINLLWVVLQHVPRRFRSADALRQALCQLYAHLVPMLVVADPMQALVAILRGTALAGKNSGDGEAMCLSFWGSALACLGRLSAARSIFLRAERCAEGIPYATGVVYQNWVYALELPAGAYDRGLSLVDQAVDNFRQTGDLSVAAISLFTKAAYARDREPVSLLLSWLEQAEQTARRQDNQRPRMGIDALRLLLRARRGEPVARQARQLAAELVKWDAIDLDVISAHATLIHTLLTLGRPSLALEEAAKAAAKLRPGPAPAMVIDIHAAVATAALRAQPTRRQRSVRRLLRLSMRQIKRYERKIPALWAAGCLLRGERALLDGRTRSARRHLAKLIGRSQQHGQHFLVLQAHLLLSRLESGQNPLAAAEHLRAARGIASSLEVQLPMMQPTSWAAEETATEATSDVATPENRTLDLGEVLATLQPSLEESLHGRKLDVHCSAAKIIGRRAELEQLLVNLVLAARDATMGERLRLSIDTVNIDPRDAARIAEGRSGAHVCVSVQLGRAREGMSKTLAGLSACRHAVSRLGGFLHLDRQSLGGALTAYLPAVTEPTIVVPKPAVEAGARSAAVVHTDPRVRQTLTNTLVGLGLDCVQTDAVNALPDSHFDVVFAEASASKHLAGRDRLRVVLLVPRQQLGRAAGQEALGLPFSTDEIEALLKSEQ